MTVTTKYETYLKESTEPAKTLTEDGKILLESGLDFPSESIEKVNGHYKIIAYIYQGHAKTKGLVKNSPSNEAPTQMSSEGLNMLKNFEGFRKSAYQDSAGVWTIGYGHTATARPGMVISRTQGKQLLRQDLKRFEKAVRDRVDVPLTQNQFNALVSFSFNVGVGAFSSSTLLKRLNQGDYKGASKEFRKWVHAGGRRIGGLVKRRRKEAELFLQ